MVDANDVCAVCGAEVPLGQPFAVRGGRVVHPVCVRMPTEPWRPDPQRPDVLRGRMTLVASDDRDGTRGALVGALRRAGAISLEAGSAATALSYLDTLAIDIIVTDLELPDDVGPLLSFARHRQTPVVVVTADAELRSDARTLGFDAALPKPVDDAAAVVDEVRAVLVARAPGARGSGAAH